MTHNRNEGHPGFVISQMLDVSKESIKANPNVILLFVGSNNMNKDTDAEKSPAAMGKTLDGLFKAAPNATILVSSLTTSKDEAAAKRIEKFAKDLVPVVKTRADAGKHVYLVDMTKLLDTKTDFKDTLHPNDAGFKKIADSWYKGLEEVEKKGWIQKPVGKTTTQTDRTKTHDESQSESEKESHDRAKKVNADGSKVETSKDQESSQNAAAQSDTSTEKTNTTGPNGTKSSNTATTHDESNSASEKESIEKSKKIGANGSQETSVKTSEEAKAAEEEANSKKQDTNVVNADGSTSSSSSSSDDSSKSSSESSSTSSSTQTISKRSAKFRLLKA